MSNFCKVKFCIFRINNTRKMTINGISSKLIPRRLIPMFCGIKREIANTIKDDFIKKYVLEYFLEKIAELTPHSNQNNKRFYIKKTKPLETTKKYFEASQSLTGVELKEFSLLYLVINKLDLLQANIHLIENIKLFI